jgi:serine/threonine-protein kinase
LNSEHRQLIDQVFTRALEMPGDSRAAYIAAACPNDAIKDEVLALLSAATSEALDERFDAARERIWREIAETDSAPEEDLAGQRVGAWKIGKRLARGGLATVFLAEREGGEFEQTAAFKVLRRGLDTDDVIARFRAERQILSALDHPAIAQILDGGALPDGRPYLVLEYVDGVAITDYCRETNASLRDRVGLIIQVLRALHHAHRHTVVHRDIKPSNIHYALGQPEKREL